jgi:hypothetical protein
VKSFSVFVTITESVIYGVHTAPGLCALAHELRFMSQADLAGIFAKLQHLDGVELDKVARIPVHAAIFLV